MKKHNTMKVVLLVVTAIWLLASLVLPDKSWAQLIKAFLTLVELFLIILNVKENHNIVKGVIITALVFMILTWILPAAYYSSGFIDQGRIQMGLFDLFNYPLTAVAYFGYISLFVLAVGGFYGVLHKIPAYRSFLDKIVAGCKGKEGIVLSIIMILVAVITSVCGLQLGLFVFFPMLAAVILLMGYDKIVAALALVGSAVVGIAGTTFGYTNVSVLYSTLGLDIMDNIAVKVVILLAGLVLLIFNTLMYAKSAKVARATLTAEKKVIRTEEVENEKIVVEEVKTEDKVTTNKTATKSASKNTKATNQKKNSTKKTAAKSKSSSKASRKDNKAAAKGDDVIVVKESLMDESLEQYVPTVVDSKHKTWPIIVGFIFMFVIMILAFMPWSVFEIEAFSKASEAVSSFKLFGFEIFGKILGTFANFGEWTIKDMIIVMTVVALVLVYIYKIKIDDVIEGFTNGAKKALAPAFLVIVVYTILVAVTYHPFQTTIYEALFGLTKGFNVVTTSVAGLLSGLFNSDAAYAFQAVVPHFAGVVTNTDVYPIAAILFQSIYGVSMLVAPTSVVLIVVLNYLGISFKQWFKAVWKLLVELFVVLLIVFTILILI